MERIICFDTLEELRIDSCRDAPLSDALIATLARRTKKLRRLQLSYDNGMLTHDCFMALDGLPITRSLEQISLLIAIRHEDEGQGLIAAGLSVFHNLRKIAIRTEYENGMCIVTRNSRTIEGGLS